MIETKIYTRIPCESCNGAGKIPNMNETKLYDHSYCSYCWGAGFYDAWIDITKFKAVLDRL
uniref:Uncharacterized protein n=1 Tax=viral metagenome TaxID=1070528 RepID=A0A6M3KQI6_9ZZZZ